MKKFIAISILITLMVSVLSLSVNAADDGGAIGNVPTARNLTVDAEKDAAYEQGLIVNLAEEGTDTTGICYFLWEAGYLYIYGEITDATIGEYTEEQLYEVPYASDYLGFFVNPDNNGANGGDVINTLYRGTYASNAWQSMNQRVNGESTEYKGKAEVGDKYAMAGKLTDTGYVVELKIPMAGVAADSKVGLHIRLYDVFTAEGEGNPIDFTNELLPGAWDVDKYSYIVLSAADVTTEIMEESAPTIAGTPAAGSPAQVGTAPGTVATAPQTGDTGIALLVLFMAAAAVFAVAACKKVRIK
jgi:hypothetical protein